MDEVYEQEQVHISTKRLDKIFDDKYERTYVNTLMKNQLHILLEQQHNELIKCFKKHKELINGTFGTCKIDPVEFE